MVLISCKNCKKVYKKENYDSFLCDRCNHIVKKRVENSLQISLALTICAMLLYIPAMVYPMMVVTQFGVNLESTIIEGVISFFTWKLFYSICNIFSKCCYSNSKTICPIFYIFIFKNKCKDDK
ncbi:MAG: paraquat-inducible protein A [Arcobacter sp.]|nr:paraquat-inducible protein A [Arcobacter sp.]